MLLKLCWIGKTKAAPIRALTEAYVKSIRRYVPAETIELRSESALLELLARNRSKSLPSLVLLDTLGRQTSSEELADFLRQQQDRGVHTLMFAVGPADGWSEELKAKILGGLAPVSMAQTLSLGKLTLAHELARVVLLEQIYRGFTILAGHPYHLGHL